MLTQGGRRCERHVVSTVCEGVRERSERVEVPVAANTTEENPKIVQSRHGTRVSDKKIADAPLVVIDAENVRRSTWPNLSKQELVERARAWARAEGVPILIVFDGPPPEDAPDLIGSGGRTADDVIVELEGPFWLVSSDRGLRERVRDRAEKIIGGGSFVKQLVAST
jgi:hypothetical protein